MEADAVGLSFFATDLLLKRFHNSSTRHRNADVFNPNRKVIPPRFGHSMVFEPTTRTLYIFAGQSRDRFLSDMYAYDVATGDCTELYSNFTAAGGPEASFAQRSLIDPQLKEMYM